MGQPRVWAIVGGGAIAILATVILTAPREDRALEELKASNEVLSANAEKLRQTNLEITESMLGAQDFKIYQLCHRATPTTKEHQRLCERVEKKLADAQAKAKKDHW